jgi:hypothetical protein
MCSTHFSESIDIKFTIFELAEQKIWNFKVWHQLARTNWLIDRYTAVREKKEHVSSYYRMVLFRIITDLICTIHYGWTDEGCLHTMASESGSTREDDMTSSSSGVPAILGDGEVHEGVRLLTCVTPAWSALTRGVRRSGNHRRRSTMMLLRCKIEQEIKGSRGAAGRVGKYGAILGYEATFFFWNRSSEICRRWFC